MESGQASVRSVWTRHYANNRRTARDNVVLCNNDNDHSLAIIRSYAMTLNTLNYTRHSINRNEGDLDQVPMIVDLAMTMTSHRSSTRFPSFCALPFLNFFANSRFSDAIRWSGQEEKWINRRRTKKKEKKWDRKKGRKVGKRGLPNCVVDER